MIVMFDWKILRAVVKKPHCFIYKEPIALSVVVYKIAQHS